MTVGLSVAWWNAGIFNGIGGVADSSKRAVAVDVVKALADHVGVDLIGLCEVSPDDVIAIEAALSEVGCRAVSLHGRDGRVRFDMCVVYRLSMLAIVDASICHHAICVDDRKLRIGVSLRLRATGVPDEFATVLSHWPSRMYMPDRSPARVDLGRELKHVVSGLGDKRPVMLMGDYNDEPYSDAIFQHLGAVRDHVLAIKGRRIYNPFWRHLAGGRFPEDAGCSVRHGSHRYGRGRIQTWWMFDQIMVTHAFLTGKTWTLNEGGVDVVDLVSLVRDCGYKAFDHLPVKAEIVWKM